MQRTRQSQDRKVKGTLSAESEEDKSSGLMARYNLHVFTYR